MPEQGLYDVPYGLASANLTTGKVILCTTGADYHGMSIVAGTTANATVVIYDNASDTTGNRVDLVIVEQNHSVWIDRSVPVKAKNGLVSGISGEGAYGVLFYGPKG